MKTKSSETAANPQSAGRTFAELMADLDREEGLGGASLPYTGPPFGMFRELDFALLDPRARAVAQRLGRLLWRNFQLVRNELLRGSLPEPPPLPLAASAVAAELRYNAATLAAALPSATGEAESVKLLETSRKTARRLEALGLALESSVRLEKVAQP
jgi:hypothetical protein